MENGHRNNEFPIKKVGFPVRYDGHYRVNLHFPMVFLWFPMKHIPSTSQHRNHQAIRPLQGPHPTLLALNLRGQALRLLSPTTGQLRGVDLRGVLRHVLLGAAVMVLR